jgi:hypothetical protein
MRRASWGILLLAAVAMTACEEPKAEGAWPQITALDHPNDGGRTMLILWQGAPEGATLVQLLRAEKADAPDSNWIVVAEGNGRTSSLTDAGEMKQPPPNAQEKQPKPEDGKSYWYRVQLFDGEEPLASSDVAGPATCYPQIFDTSKTMVLLTVVGFGLLLAWFVRLSTRNPDIYVRPIGGLAAINEAIGRATEMGRPDSVRSRHSPTSTRSADARRRHGHAGVAWPGLRRVR